MMNVISQEKYEVAPEGQLGIHAHVPKLQNQGIAVKNAHL